MRTCHAIIVASLALLLTPATAIGQALELPEPAPSSGDVILDDLRCFKIMSFLGQSAPAEAQQSFGLSAIYFLGKLLGRNPDFSFAQAEATYAQRITQIDSMAEYSRCHAEFGAVGHMLRANPE